MSAKVIKIKCTMAAGSNVIPAVLRVGPFGSEEGVWLDVSNMDESVRVYLNRTTARALRDYLDDAVAGGSNLVEFEDL